MENRYWNQGNPAKLLTDLSKKLAFDDTQQQDSVFDFDTQGDVVQSADDRAFLAPTPYKFHGGEK
jgi:hypothetical protein